MKTVDWLSQLGGVLKPNDGQCHLDATGMHTTSIEQDYPSLGLISRLSKDNSINLIMAVTQYPFPAYRAFSKIIEGSSVGKLDRDSSNIVSLVYDQYAVRRPCLNIAHISLT